MAAASWSVRAEDLSDGRGQRLSFEGAEGPVPYAEVCAAWRDDAPFRLLFRRLIADIPFAAVLWETPPVTRTTFDRAFECMLLESSALARMEVDPVPFHDWIQRGEDVVTFANLGGDAILVAPCARDRDDCYPHLAAFARKGSESQWHALWRNVALAVEERVAETSRPLWISTSGLGVAWLHVRLDDRPKYVTHQPYWEAP